MNAIEINVGSVLQTLLANTLAALLGNYTFSQKNALEQVDSVVSEHGFREYHAYCLESQYQGDDLRISFSLYRDKKTNGEKDEYDPMEVEFLLGGANIEDEKVFLTHWVGTLEQIKADLFSNSFPDEVEQVYAEEEEKRFSRQLGAYLY